MTASGDERREAVWDAASLRALADEVSPTVEAVLADLNERGLRSGGEVLERRPGEITWTLQFQVVGLRVAVVRDGGPHFWVAYYGPPNGNAAPAQETTSLDPEELRQALWTVMRSVVREGRPA